tara:strand:+ start:1124 stop:1294 length:171 start_codon:yes stop_codon:yes gene_type:complete
MSPAETLYNEVKQSILEILEGACDVELDDIIESLEKDTGDTVLTFDLAEIFEELSK